MSYLTVVCQQCNKKQADGGASPDPEREEEVNGQVRKSLYQGDVRGRSLSHLKRLLL